MAIRARNLSFMALLFCMLGVHGRAHAQELCEAGNLTFSIERLFGVYVGSQTVDLGPTDADSDWTDFSLGWNGPPTALTTPRLGIDYFIDEHLTLGGNLGFFSLSSDPADTTGLIFAGRVGYALRLSHAISFWPRVGISYSVIDGPIDRSMFALDLEGMFSLSPADGWSVLVGPLVDLGVAGKVAKNDATETNFGIMVGMLGYLGT